MVDRILAYAGGILTIIGIGVSIGIFQERLNALTKIVEKSDPIISGFDVILQRLDVIEARLTRLDFSRESLAMATPRRGGSDEYAASP